MQKLFIFIFLGLVCNSVLPQSSIDVVFNEKTHNYGSVKEEEGIVTTSFFFVNVSNKPIFIKNVRASCGCTLPSYTLEPIAPNAVGNIAIGYNPDGRPGHFNKAISVQIGDDKNIKTYELTIKGDVLSKHENNFTTTIGSLKFREDGIDIGSVIKGNVVDKTFDVYNPMNKDIKLSFSSIPNFITIYPAELTLKANQKTSIKLAFNSNESMLNQISTIIDININGKAVAKFPINSDVKSNFSNITIESFTKRPEILVEPQYVNLTTIKQGEKRTTKIKIKNRGVNPLEIRNITLQEPYISIYNPNKDIVLAGQYANIEVTIDTKKLNVSSYQKSFQIATNDPLYPIIDVYMEWSVIK